jgi:hypothetical protein
MGIEAYYQAMPESCDLFVSAQKDHEIADQIMSFNLYMVQVQKQWPDSPKWVEFYEKSKQAMKEHPGLENRYFCAGGRTFDAIIYLLSPARRSLFAEQDRSLIRIAVRGFEALHPLAQGIQGGPINFVPAPIVPLIAEYLSLIDQDILYEHYDPHWMYESGVYKMHPTDPNNSRFEAIWEEFDGMREVYQGAAHHGEAVITVIQ